MGAWQRSVGCPFLAGTGTGKAWWSASPAPERCRPTKQAGMKHDPSRSRFNSTHRARARSRAMAGSTYGTPDHAQLWARTDPLNLWNVRGRRRIDHRDAPDDGLLVPFPISHVTRSAKWPSTAVVADH